jgi:hypothetical protein
MTKIMKNSVKFGMIFNKDRLKGEIFTGLLFTRPLFLPKMPVQADLLRAAPQLQPIRLRAASGPPPDRLRAASGPGQPPLSKTARKAAG